MKRLSTLVLLSGLAASAQALELQSNDLADGGTISAKHVFDQWGCEGQNISPHLSWSDIPEGTKSFVLTVYDPDAPTISGFWHWVAFNIPANVTELKQGAGAMDGQTMPVGSVQSKTDFNQVGYGGPCPPQGHGPHRYQFSIHAMKVEKIDFGPEINPALIGYQIYLNGIESATITATYHRD
ncbi:YbhB/YbcL family Raf kinase inhibitor-like protein [Motilimonas cestriensis]|uniref:YbhB/YbcL family Raf kinase inhibitor-like protein n=1 Tax=Motilimonas cestriensis TaxID=2742685 RepID=UPI003DA33BB3